MTDLIKEILDDEGCDDYEICLGYLRQCFPNIDYMTQDDYYVMGRAEFIKMAKECLAARKEK